MKDYFDSIGAIMNFSLLYSFLPSLSKGDILDLFITLALLLNTGPSGWIPRSRLELKLLSRLFSFVK
jgi:hypothetical protein